MAIDLRAIEKAGGTDEKLRAKFTAKPEERGAKITELIQLQSARIDEGVRRGLDLARHWRAIDDAYDVPHQQVTYTMVKGLLDRNPSSKEVLQAATDWGLTNMLTAATDAAGKPAMLTDRHGRPIPNTQSYTLDLPTFFNIFVPVVMAYHKVRWAKLFNDRDLWPLYKYSPAVLTMRERAKCEIITHRIARMSAEMGYRQTERQSIFGATLYGEALNFPEEDFWKERRILADGSKKVTREGVRFRIPHPSRVFYDRTQPVWQFNTDTGPDWAGYWDLCRYGDVIANRAWWNTDMIRWHQVSSWPTSREFEWYSKIYPCTVKFPSSAFRCNRQGQLERTEDAFVYSDANHDEAVSVVSFFHRLVPADWDLFDYDEPLWMRFMFAAEDTVIHAAPFAYAPVVAYLYDHDANRARPTGMGVELLPFQDHFSNLLTQLVLTVKRNLMKVVFWNRQILRDDQVKRIQNLGEKLLRTTEFIPFSPRELGFGQQTIGQAFFPVNFPPLPTNEIVTTITTLLSVLERMMGFSAQEIGAAATHEQSAREVMIVHSNTGVRLEFTGSFMDDAIEARKRLLFEAFAAYGDDEIFAEVSDMDDTKRATLKEMGFAIEDGPSGTSKAGVIGSKKLLAPTAFAADRDGTKRPSDEKVATALLQFLQVFIGNPQLVEFVGAEQLFERLNDIWTFIGLPTDRRWKPRGDAQGKPTTEDVQMQFAELAKQLVDKQLGDFAGVLKTQLLEPLQAKMQQTDAAMGQMAQEHQGQQAAIAELFKRLDAVMALATAPPLPSPGGPGPVLVPPSSAPLVPVPPQPMI